MSCLLPAGLSAASTLSDTPPFILAPKDLQAQATQQAAAATAPAVILLNDEHWTFHPDNTIDRKTHLIYKILDASAIQSWSSIQERWEPWHQDRPVLRARVITQDGVEHQLDQKALVDAPAASNVPQTFSDVRILQGPLPAVETGAVVEAELDVHFTPVLGSLAFRSYVAAPVPVEFARLTAEYPESLQLRYAVSLCPGLKETKETRNGTVYLSLTFGAFKKITDLDQLLPFDADRFPGVTLSTGTSWHDLATGYERIVNQQLDGAPVQPLVAKAMKSGDARPVVIESLVRSLHSQVRYTGVEFADAAIIPAKPADTLSRKYGDCKDKAALLVAMLRAAGIPAYIALLNAGLDQDVSPQLPGMGMFNHAIVYVPGTPATWIDATAEHMRVGSLPSADEGRLALVISPETKDLVKIPESPAASNIATTQVDYYLPDFGPARISQVVSGSGSFDSTFRDIFSLLDNEDFRKRVEQQTQAQWNTKLPVKLTHSALNDYSTAFLYTSEIPETKNLIVSETDATVDYPVNSIFSSLPAFFFTPDPSGADKSSQEVKPPRTAGFVLPVGFETRLSCRTHLPKGFSIKKIPDNQTLKLGPADFSSRYVLTADTLTADFSFNAGKRSYTLEEGNALKTALLEFLKQPGPQVTLQPVGQKLMDEGRLREGLDQFRSLAAEHSKEAVNHVRLSRAYLSVGCGKEARQEAELANKSAPNLVVTWRNLAWVYQHDLVGRQFKPGWAPAMVETALNKAASLDPDDLSIKTELAQTFAYDAGGNSYESKERLSKGVAILKSMGDDKVEEQNAQDNLLYDLARLEQLDDLKLKLERFGSNGSRAGYQAYLTTLREGADKAAAGLRASGTGDTVKQSFFSAAGLLAVAGKYQQEADLAVALHLESELFMPADDLRKMHRVDPKTIQPDSPEHLVQCFGLALGTPGETSQTLARFWSASMPSDALQPLLKNWQRTSMAALASHGTSWLVARDAYLVTTKFSSDNNGDAAFRVRSTSAGRTFMLLVARENGAFKLLGNADLPQGIIVRALSDLENGNEQAARKWLDWLRDMIKLRSEDDPLGGPVFPRIWNKGAASSAAQIRYAAASLLFSKDALPILKEAAAASSEAAGKPYYELAYARVCAYLKLWNDCLPVAKSLAAAYPGSETAQRLLALSYAGTGQMPEAERLLKAAIEANGDELALKRTLTESLESAGELKRAATAARDAAETTNSGPGDWNQFGWISLVAGTADENATHAVEKAVGQPVPAIQHTIASMYAEIGKVSEARHIALDSLEKFGFESPDSAWYYVFGRIAEQLGAKTSAISNYQNVQPEYKAGSPVVDDKMSTYSLAQKRLGILNSMP